MADTVLDHHLVLRRRRAGRHAEQLTGDRADPRASAAEAVSLDLVEAADACLLAREPGIEAIAPTMPMRLVDHAASAPAATSATSWGIRAVGADTSPFDGSGIVVGIVDTGINASHEAFAGVTIEERDFSGAGPGDPSGHGTHAAGTIFGRDVAETRIGVARGVTRAVIAKAFGDDGGTTTNLVRGILWAVERGAHVVALSSAIDFAGYRAGLLAQGLPDAAATSRALDAYRQTIRMFDRLGHLVESMASFYQPCLLFAAAGDHSARGARSPYEVSAGLPAAADGFISVSAAQESPSGGLRVHHRSNTGVTLCAPGTAIVSAAVASGLNMSSGTSTAAPHAAGVAVLWAQKLAASGGLDTRRWLSHLLASADASVLAGEPDAKRYGAGLVQAPHA